MLFYIYRHSSKRITYIILFNLLKPLCEISTIIFSFIDEKTQVQRGGVTCIRSRSWQVVKPGFENRLTSHPHTN